VNSLLPALLPVLAAYAIGSIPFGLLVARLAKGVDIRTVGSGNIGATNVARSIGKSWGILVLLLDAVKGLVPTLFFPLLTMAPGDPGIKHIHVLCGLAAILGHMYPCWLRFRGGKGVATTLGVVVVLVPWASLIATGVFALTFAIWRIVSLSSMLAAVSFAAYSLWKLWPTPFAPDTWTTAVFSLAIPLLIIIRHRSNLTRLLKGEEPRFGQKPNPSKSDTDDSAES